MSFEADLAAHLAAIRARDLAALAATVDPEDVVLVAADGEVAFGREEFLRRHADWFASATWSIETETLHVREAGDLATCLLAFRYLDHPPGAAPIDERSILALVFRRRGDQWLMVMDQNTPIRR